MWLSMFKNSVVQAANVNQSLILSYTVVTVT